MFPRNEVPSAPGSILKHLRKLRSRPRGLVARLVYSLEPPEELQQELFSEEDVQVDQVLFECTRETKGEQR